MGKCLFLRQESEIDRAQATWKLRLLAFRWFSRIGIMIKNWLILFVAIVSEVIATSALKSSEGFSRFWPSVIVVIGYGIAFYCLALTLRVIPMGVVYAIWSGIGIVLITLVGWFLFNQKLDLPALLGIGLIAAGVVVMNVFSNTMGH